MDKYNFPKQVFQCYAKNTNDAVIDIAATLRTVSSMSMSKQSINKEVLVNVKRGKYTCGTI